jgi:hypothetical protein
MVQAVIFSANNCVQASPDGALFSIVAQASGVP